MKAILCGYYGKGNAGDEALLASLLQMLPREITPIVLSGNPQETQNRYGVESCDRASAFPILRALDQSDFLIWGGGSLMQDVTSFRNPFYYGGLMALAQQRGLKTIAWAQGIGPLKYKQTQWITRKVLQGCVAVSVRDRASAELLSDWKIPFMLASDPVWALQATPVESLFDFPSPRVAVTLRQHSQLTPQRLESLTQALIEFQKATQTFLLLVPFQPSQDLAIAQTIAKQLSPSHAIISLEDPKELKGLFQGVEMSIGMRLHSLIMAASESCRCFALSYDPKVTQLMEELNLPGWKLEEIPENPQIISQTWIDYYTKGVALNQSLIQSLMDRAYMNQDLLTNAISNLAKL